MLNFIRDTIFTSYLIWFTGEDALGFRTDDIKTSEKERKCFSDLLYSDINIKRIHEIVKMHRLIRHINLLFLMLLSHMSK